MNGFEIGDHIGLQITHFHLIDFPGLLACHSGDLMYCGGEMLLFNVDFKIEVV